MILRQTLLTGVFSLVASTLFVSPAQAQAETFTATAEVKTAGGAPPPRPSRSSLTQDVAGEADSLTGAFKTGGAAALRKALVGVKPTGTVG